jgi:hypothetical protein
MNNEILLAQIPEPPITLETSRDSSGPGWRQAEFDMGARTSLYASNEDDEGWRVVLDTRGETMSPVEARALIKALTRAVLMAERLNREEGSHV